MSKPTLFRRLFEKRDWRRVKTIEMSIIRSLDKESGTLYYYLYENQFGDRRMDVADTFRGDMDLNKVEKTDVVYRSSEYLEIIKPWLEGDYDPEITDYDGVKRKEMLSALKGEKV